MNMKKKNVSNRKIRRALQSKKRKQMLLRAAFIPGVFFGIPDASATFSIYVPPSE